jgi:hypothetical protein
MTSMDIAEIAKALGRRGGLSRARRLSKQRLEDIARTGATARGESLRLARAIRTNFEYVRAMHELHPPAVVRSETNCRRRLPGIYAAETER